LTEKLSPEVICTTIGLCTETKAKKPRSIVIPKGADNGFACTICQDVIRLIDDYLEDGKTEQEIIDLVTKYCDMIPAPYGTICDALVAQYIPTIIQFLTEELDPEVICSTIGLCTETKAKKPRSQAISKTADNGFTCTLCENVIRMIDDFLKDGKTEQEIIDLLTKYCEMIPAPYGTICDSLVAQYIPAIIQYLTEKLTPDMICTKIGLCTETQKVHAQPRKIQQRAEDGVGCDVCKDFIDWAEKELKEYSTAALWQLVSVECPKIPHLSKFCSLITEGDISTILNLIISKLPSKTFCEWIKFC